MFHSFIIFCENKKYSSLVYLTLFNSALILAETLIPALIQLRQFSWYSTHMPDAIPGIDIKHCKIGIAGCSAKISHTPSCDLWG